MNPESSNKPVAENDAEKIKRPKSVTTAKGSVYTYLEDGTTQRYKKVEDEMNEPQDVLVFIPKISELKDWQHFNRLPDWMKEYNNNQVMEMLSAEYIRSSEKRVVLTDETNRIIKSNAEAMEAKELLLHFVDKKTNQTQFALPVSTEPKVGSSTYDVRYFEKDGKGSSSAHIGNEVTSIEYFE